MILILKTTADIAESVPNSAPKFILPIGRWTYRTRPIVRLDVMNRMVTKGYQKGVYERVTKETWAYVTTGPAEVA